MEVGMQRLLTQCSTTPAKGPLQLEALCDDILNVLRTGDRDDESHCAQHASMVSRRQTGPNRTSPRNHSRPPALG
jgi:hypothetical protein